jgi:hypothetical protein
MYFGDLPGLFVRSLNVLPEEDQLPVSTIAQECDQMSEAIAAVVFGVGDEIADSPYSSWVCE